jgi:hypothetical protein
LKAPLQLDDRDTRVSWVYAEPAERRELAQPDMHGRLELSSAPAVNDSRFPRARKERVVQEGVERFDCFRRGLAVQIQSTCNVLSAGCYVLTCYVLTCNVLTCNVLLSCNIITCYVVTCYVPSATCDWRAAGRLRRLQVDSGNDNGTPLQVDEEPAAIAHFAHDSGAESRDVHAIANGEGRHQLLSIARALDAR